MPRGRFWYLYITLTHRGRGVIIALAIAVEAILVVLDWQIPNIEFALMSICPLIALAIAINYVSAVAISGLVAVIVSLLETPPPQALTNSAVWYNAAFYWCGYLIVLSLLAGLSALATPLRRFLADFNELRAARRKLVPENLPALGDWRMSVVEVLRDELTGIFYDVDVSSSSIDLFAASVVEHGMQAALVLPALKALWSREGVLPPASLQRLNLRLSPLLAGDMSVHAWHGKFYDDGLVRYATAGFYGAFLVGADGSTRRLAGGGNSLCGRSDPGIAEGMYIVDPGTTLVVGNDGFCRLVEQEIIELRNAARNPAGLQTLLRALELDRDILAVVVTRHSKLLPGHQLDDTVAQFG